MFTRMRLCALLLASACMMLAPAAAMAARGVVTAGTIVLREEADLSSRKLFTVYKGSKVDVLSESDGWYRVSYGRYTGYVRKDYISVTGEITSDGVLRPGDSGSDVRELQQLLKKRGYYSGSIDGQYGRGTERAVRYFQDAAGLTVDGKAGEKTLAALRSSSTGNSASGSTTAPDDGVLRPGDSGSDVKALQQLLKKHGYYSGSIDGKYGCGTERAVRYFQDDAGLTVDGKAGEKTLAALKVFTPTESLDWFRNGASAIPKGAVFTVKDVLTGETFRLKRWSGANHADCEPLTAEDTATLKSVYGGSWSWRRRAILVSYNGHVYAASMNGMPHGDDTISGNGFNGHICIHFTGSKTHGTQKVDSEHQNAVKRALEASW